MNPRNKSGRFDILIIGGGAAGLMAAVRLCGTGKRVLVLEKMRQAGLKLRITGKGRCNLTNTLPINDFLSRCSNGERNLRNAVSFFSNQDTINFFEDLGLPLVEERGHRVFPRSGKSLDVFLSLVRKIEASKNVDLVCNKGVERILIENNAVRGVRCFDGDVFHADKVLLCCGGESYPATGSNGDGIRLAYQSGHKITPTMPALVGIRTKIAHPASLQNYTVKNVQVCILDDKGKILERDFGDMSLDEYGLAGSVILRLSRKIAERLYKKERLFVSVDMKPKLSEEKLKKEISRVLQERVGQSTDNILRAWLSEPLVRDYKFWLKKQKESLKVQKHRLGNAEAIMLYLKYNKDEIIGDMGWYEAIVTKGGVDLSQVNCRSMQSKIVKGLYFAGEVLDFDGDTGGFNLQTAFSTAALACSNMQ